MTRTKDQFWHCGQGKGWNTDSCSAGAVLRARQTELHHVQLRWGDVLGALLKRYDLDASQMYNSVPCNLT